MKQDRIQTLYLDANGSGRNAIIADTVLRGLLGYRDGAAPPSVLRQLPIAVKAFGYLRPLYDHMSYASDWRDTLCHMPELEVEVCNINNLVHYATCLRHIRRYDLIVVSHAASGDDMTLLRRTCRWLARRRGKLLMFIGNEYDLLDEKISFMQSVRADMICSQLPEAAARYLYHVCDQSQLMLTPEALNPHVYYPNSTACRQIDIGFVGDIYWPFIGDRERTDLIRYFEARGVEMGLTCDIRTQRLPRLEWAQFLNACQGTIGAESGTYYLNDRGRLLAAARAYNLQDNQQATFEDVFERFFKDQPRGVSGKSISSRHLQPIGTKTCQILLEGDYNHILKADEHYISVKKDLSNIDEAIRQFKDEGYRREIAERAYDHVMSKHTYRHRLQAVLDTLSW